MKYFVEFSFYTDGDFTIRNAERYYDCNSCGTKMYMQEDLNSGVGNFDTKVFENKDDCIKFLKILMFDIDTKEILVDWFYEMFTGAINSIKNGEEKYCYRMSGNWEGTELIIWTTN